MGPDRSDPEAWESVRAGRGPTPLIAIVVLATAVALAVVRGNGGDPAPADDAGTGLLEVSSEPATPGLGGGEPVGTVRRIPSAPVQPRAGAHAVWTGDEVLVWSGAIGELQPVAGGAAFDPRTGTWRALPDAPITPRAGAAAVWARDRMVVWGGFAGPGEPLDDGAAYLPGQDRWLLLPPAPLSARGHTVTAWTGREVLLVGGAQRAGRPWGRTSGAQRDGAAYNPVTGRWRPLPPVPDGVWPVQQRFAGAWVDGLLVVWGRDIGLYDPEADAWERRPAPASSLWPGAGVQIVALDGAAAVLGVVLRDDPDTFGFIFRPDTGTVRPVPQFWPRSAMTSEFEAIVDRGVGRLVVVSSTPPSAASWPLGAGDWEPLPVGLGERTGAAAVWTGVELVVWGGWDGQSPRSDGLAWTP